jgi:hypothetical protein
MAMMMNGQGDDEEDEDNGLEDEMDPMVQAQKMQVRR